MTFSDIMALAKNGYKPGDIKELMALQPDTEQSEQSGANESDQEQSEQSGANESNQEQSEQSEQSGANEMEALKKQVAELTKKLNDTQSELHKAQKANTQTNVKKDSGQSDTERLNDWARSFM